MFYIFYTIRCPCFEYNNKVIIDDMHDKENGWSKKYYNIIEEKYKMIIEKNK